MTLGDYSREARCALEERIRTALNATNSVGTVTGTVTFSGDDSFYIQQDDDGFKIVVDDSAAERFPAAGDVVEVEGSPSLEGGRVVFAAKKWRKIDTDELPAARSADEDDLVFAGDENGVRFQRVCLRHQPPHKVAVDPAARVNVGEERDRKTAQARREFVELDLHARHATARGTPKAGASGGQRHAESQKAARHQKTAPRFIKDRVLCLGGSRPWQDGVL